MTIDDLQLPPGNATVPSSSPSPSPSPSHRRTIVTTEATISSMQGYMRPKSEASTTQQQEYHQYNFELPPPGDATVLTPFHCIKALSQHKL